MGGCAAERDLPASRYCFSVSVSPSRARSNSFAARSSAAGGKSAGVLGGSGVPFVMPVSELAALGSIGADILNGSLDFRE